MLLSCGGNCCCQAQPRHSALFQHSVPQCTSTTVAGVSLTGDLSIPAESPVLQAEASAATYSSSRLSSQSVSPVPVTPPDASALLEAALSPDMAVDTMAFYGALHQLHAESSLTAGRVAVMSALTTSARASLAAPWVFTLGSVQLLCSDAVNVSLMSQLVPHGANCSACHRRLKHSPGTFLSFMRHCLAQAAVLDQKV